MQQNNLSFEERLNRVRSNQPDYLVVSTSYAEEETYVFEGDSDGNILSLDNYGGIAKRYGDDNWQDPDAAIADCFPESIYTMICQWDNGYGIQYLYGLERPDAHAERDLDESDRIMC